MIEYKTSNDLTDIYGDLPTTNGPCKDINRGYIVYVQLLGKGAFLNGRALWTSYNKQNDPKYDNCPKTQKDFVNQVLELADSGKLLDLEICDEPFRPGHQNCFSADISKVDFGWIPCNVTYIFDNAGIKFLEEDPTNAYQHPAVFRKTKAVKGEKKEYLKNDSFYNLTVDNTTYPNKSILHMKNCMTTKNQSGDFINIAEINKTDRYEYCLDIPIDVSQEKIFQGIFGIDKLQTTAENEDKGLVVGNLLEAITFVFDPPQGNGGGNGPPDYP